MCYILVKDYDKHDGCVALETETGDKLVKLKSELEKITRTVKEKNIEVVIISKPEMYGEYAPYSFVKTPKELIDRTKELVSTI